MRLFLNLKHRASRAQRENAFLSAEAPPMFIMQSKINLKPQTSCKPSTEGKCFPSAEAPPMFIMQSMINLKPQISNLKPQIYLYLSISD